MVKSLLFPPPPPEIPHEQEEPDSAFEATQYFFEDITPETSMGKDLTFLLRSLIKIMCLDCRNQTILLNPLC